MEKRELCPPYLFLNRHRVFEEFKPYPCEDIATSYLEKLSMASYLDYKSNRKVPIVLLYLAFKKAIGLYRKPDVG